MAIYPINPNQGIKKGSSVAKIGATNYLEKYDRSTFCSGIFVDPTGYNNKFINQDQAWGLGTGFLANTTAASIFTNSSGFSLRDFTITNRGPNPVYVSFNITGWDITKSMQINTSESVNVNDNIIRNIWVQASGSNSVVHGYGTRLYIPYVY